MADRKPGYFSGQNYYSFTQDENTLEVLVMSECCGDTLDIDAAIELRDLLNEYIEAACWTTVLGVLND